MTVLLDLHDVACRRGERLLFHGVQASVQSGQLLWVQGANGAGKTSLLRMICGLAVPCEGEIRWRGRSTARQPDTLNAQLVYLGHSPALKDELTALENLQASARLGGLPCGSGEARRALAGAGLRGKERLSARLLSQGQRKRAGLARLALDPSAALWVLDEPFSALDDTACGWVQALIGAQLDRGGVVVLTSHERGGPQARVPQVTIDLSAVSSAVTAARA